jgi:hypothetical protein
MRLLTKTCPPIDSAGFLHLVENQPYRFPPTPLVLKANRNPTTVLESFRVYATCPSCGKTALAARLFCQGSPLRSDKRKPGALDSADS